MPSDVRIHQENNFTNLLVFFHKTEYLSCNNYANIKRFFISYII